MEIEHQKTTVSRTSRDFEKHRRHYGAPRLRRELAATGIVANHQRVARVMKQHALVARHPRRRVRTTDSPSMSLTDTADSAGLSSVLAQLG